MIVNLDSKKEELARTFCIDVQREFQIRAKLFKPADARERRWREEGIKSVFDFETFRAVNENGAAHV